MATTPYLFFEGRAEEAAGFYADVLGAKVEMMMRIKDSPEPQPEGMTPPGSENKILHMSLRIGDGVLLGSDGMCSGKPEFKGFSLTHYAADEAEADRVFARLSQGGQVQMPLTKTFFAKRFGMLADRFGVSWMIMVQP
jgi:PhnB protein